MRIASAAPSVLALDASAASRSGFPTFHCMPLTFGLPARIQRPGLARPPLRLHSDRHAQWADRPTEVTLRSGLFGCLVSSQCGLAWLPQACRTQPTAKSVLRTFALPGARFCRTALARYQPPCAYHTHGRKRLLQLYAKAQGAATAAGNRSLCNSRRCSRDSQRVIGRLGVLSASTEGCATRLSGYYREAQRRSNARPLKRAASARRLI